MKVILMISEVILFLTVCSCVLCTIDYSQHTPVVPPFTWRYQTRCLLLRRLLALGFIQVADVADVTINFSWSRVLRRNYSHDLVSELTEQSTLERFGRVVCNHVPCRTPDYGHFLTCLESDWIRDRDSSE